MIEVDNIKRTYVTKKGIIKKTKTQKEAVRGISFKVEQGTIFGLLGPNGAGKTTTIKMLTSLILPDEGNIKLLNLDLNDNRNEILGRINFMYGGERSLYWRLSAYDNLRYFADLYHIDEVTVKKRINALLELVGLEKVIHNKVETFSKGMKQRLQIARALINDPEIIFMDEPTIGLDPSASKLLREIILDLKSLGKTVVITTHYMKEAELLCDQIGFINDGELIEIDYTENLLDKYRNKIDSIEDLEDVYLHLFGEQRSVAG